MKVEHDFDGMVVNSPRDTRVARRLGWVAAALAPVPLVALGLALWATAPTPYQTVEDVYGPAPYHREVIEQARQCVSGGVPDRCEFDGGWMEGAHAVEILENQGAMMPRPHNRARGFRYLRRLAMATGRWAGDTLEASAWGLVRGGPFTGLALFASLGFVVGMLWTHRPRAPYKVRVRHNDILFGDRAVPMHELRTCQADGARIAVGLSGGRTFTTPELELSAIELRALVDTIGAHIPSAEQRKAHARAHMDGLRTREALQNRTAEPS